MMLLKCCTQYASKFGKLSNVLMTGKKSVFIPVPQTGNAKESSNYHIVALNSLASKVIIKILQVKLQQYMNQELPEVQPGFRKDIGTRDQIASIRWITDKAMEFQKNVYYCFIDYTKALDWVDHNKLSKKRDGNTRPPYLSPEKSVCTSRSNS